MANTGIQREIDNLGRITLPMELRNALSIPAGTPLAIHLEGERIVLEKAGSFCALCGSSDDVKSVQGKHLCSSCIETIKAEF